MTTKILTLRVPTPVYSELCSNAAELGVSVSAHVRRLLEQEHQAQQVSQLRVEVLDRLNEMALAVPQAKAPPTALDEILLLTRATAAHLNPQLVGQVRAKLASQQAGA
jgi:hypothetical protein